VTLMPQKRRNPLQIIYDVLNSFRGETINQTTIYLRANLSHQWRPNEKYLDPLVAGGFLTREECGSRRYPIKLYTLTLLGRRLLLTLGGKP